MERHNIPTSEFRTASLADAFTRLSAADRGLTSTEAGVRQALYGTNEITEKKRHPLFEFLKRFWGPMPWLLELAMILSFALQHKREGVIICTLLIVNAIIGFFHARSSAKAVELLKRRRAVQTKVLRDGVWAEVSATELVPGDSIAVRIGDIVPADAKIISGHLSCDESTLTGESLPSGKKEGDILYSASIVSRGEARCLVVNTGEQTYFGKTVDLVREASTESHQEKMMVSVVEYMTLMAMAACLVITIFAYFMGTNIRLIPTFVVIFLMGAVPAALPTVMTIMQAATSMRLSRVGVLTSRLDAIEDAASIRFLLLDKTGTMTENKITVVNTLPFFGWSHDEVIRASIQASHPEEMDLIDVALSDYAKSVSLHIEPYKQVSYTPFDPEMKRTEAIVEEKDRRFRVLKGAPRVILSLCTGIDEASRITVQQAMAEAAEKGYRTIAVAQSEDLKTVHFLGLIFLRDPPRPDSKQMIEEIRSLGVRPLMLTGDSLAIARQIATEVGIGRDVIRFADIANLPPEIQVEKILASDGFAGIFPEDKYTIVKILQSKGYMVGMTGDGVNDAPALKQAEMGIAVSDATDVAKASASIVLTRAGLGVIVDAIRQSRQAYQRLLTWVINKITKVVQVIGVLAIGFFLMDKMVLSLLGMVLVVLANDFVTISLATDNVTYTMNPNSWKVRNITLAALVIGAFLVFEGVLAIVWGNEILHLPFEQLQTFVMLMFVFTSQFRVLILRERQFFWNSRPGTGLIISSAVTIVAFVFVGISGVIVPAISLGATLAVLAFSALFTLACDLPKHYAFRKCGLAEM